MPEGGEELEEAERVLFQGPMFGREANLKKNPGLVRAGLVPVKRLVSNALSRRAHTITVEPKGPRLAIRFMVDGIPYPAGAVPGKQGVAIVQMLKLLSGLELQSRGKVQSGGILAEFTNQQYRLLIDTTPVKGPVERLRIRVENSRESFITPSEINFPGNLKESIQRLSEDATGIVLACGAPESGVTSLSIVALHCMDPYLYSVFNMADVGDRQLVNVSEPDDEPDFDLELKLDRIIRQEGDAIYMGKFDDPQPTQLLF